MTEKCFSGTVFNKEEIDQLKALAATVRLDIFTMLGDPMTVSEIAQELGVDRKTLYHHVKILKSAGLIDEVDSKFVKNLKEGVYKRASGLKIHALPAVLWDQAGSKIMAAIQEMDADSQDAEYRDCDSIATVSRKRLTVNTDRLKEVQGKIVEYREEYCRNVMALADEHGDLTEIEIMCIFFDRK